MPQISLEAARVNAKLTQKEFAEMLGVSNTTVLSWEKGITEPSASQLRKISQISLDMAKQICMIQSSEKGKEYRQYFLDLEKAWNTPEQIFARALKMAEKEITKLKNWNGKLVEDVQRMKPKEIFADAVASSHTSILIGDLAKILKQNGIETGQKKLFSSLREEGFLIKTGSSKNMPTQRAMEMGLFEVKEGSYVDSNGCNITTKTTKVTGKGQQYFINRFLK